MTIFTLSLKCQFVKSLLVGSGVWTNDLKLVVKVHVSKGLVWKTEADDLKLWKLRMCSHSMNNLPNLKLN